MKTFNANNINDIVDGYYWIRNRGFDDKGGDKIIYRPCYVVVRKTGELHGNNWKSAGIYVERIGEKDEIPMHVIMKWEDVSLTPMEPPKGF